MSRGDAGDARETPEKVIVSTPERHIDTFDDLGTRDGERGIDTFDDLRRPGSEKSINTFDDLLVPTDGGDKTTTKVADGQRRDTPEMVEQRRIDQAAESIRNLDGMNSEKWKTMSIDDKRLALQSASRELGRAYNSPEPPLETKNMGDPSAQGEYGDGYSYNAKTDDVVGSDYGIRMNEDAVTRRNEKLFGENPKEVIRTCSHEFRHSYQSEQAHAYEKGFKVDDVEQARTWSENFKDYKNPPAAELAQTDPERYFKEYEAYRNQPVEVDARDFGDKVVSRTYDDARERGSR